MRRRRRIRASASIFILIWISLTRKLGNVFVIELHDSVVFTVVQMPMVFESIG
jgi:hypothetical protein